MNDWIQWVGLFIAVVAGGFGLTQFFLNRGEQRRVRREAAGQPTPPTTAEVWARLDRVEQEMRAVLGVLYDVAEQWPGAHPPKLAQHHVRILGDKLPMEWRERVDLADMPPPIRTPKEKS